MSDAVVAPPQSEVAPELSIIIVNWETRDLTLACIASVIAETHECSYELIVVDNASNDGSVETIGKAFPDVELIRSPRNLGFARANNLAVARARGRLVLLLNPDTVVIDRAIDRLAAFAYRRPEAGVWGGRTLFPDGRLNPTSCWAAMSEWNLFCRASGLAALLPNGRLTNSEAIGGWDRTGARRVDIVSGCFLLIERARWQRLDGFDEDYFMYGEDADLCLRAKALGAAPAVSSEATIIHLGGASERTRAAKLTKLLAAKATLLRRHWHPARVPLGLALLAAWPAGRVLASMTMAKAFDDARWQEAAAAWCEVWRMRAIWLAGYQSAESQELRPPATKKPRRPASSAV